MLYAKEEFYNNTDLQKVFKVSHNFIDIIFSRAETQKFIHIRGKSRLIRKAELSEFVRALPVTIKYKIYDRGFDPLKG